MLDFGMDPMDAIFGTEYQVIVERRIGICHLFAPYFGHDDPRQISNKCDPEMSEDFLINRRYATELFTPRGFPALKGRAKFVSPLRGVCIGNE